MMLYFVGISRREAGTDGEREIFRRLWLISASLADKSVSSVEKGDEDFINALFMVINNLLPALPFHFPWLNLSHRHLLPLSLDNQPLSFTQRTTTLHPHPPSKTRYNFPLA